MRKPAEPCSPGCKGWAVFESGSRGTEIQRCDSCWSGAPDAPDDEYFQRQRECRLALLEALGAPAKRYSFPNLQDDGEALHFETFCEPDDPSLVDGSFGSDDEEADRALRREILERFEAGHVEAWCTIIVVCRWVGPDGTVYEGRDSVGGCSFLADAGESYLEDYVEHSGMREEALADLCETLCDALLSGLLLAAKLARD